MITITVEHVINKTWKEYWDNQIEEKTEKKREQYIAGLEHAKEIRRKQYEELKSEFEDGN